MPGCEGTCGNPHPNFSEKVRNGIQRVLGQDRHSSNTMEARKGGGGSNGGLDHALWSDGFTFLKQRPGVCEEGLAVSLQGMGGEPGRTKGRLCFYWCQLPGCAAPPTVAGAENPGGVHLD